MKIRNSKNTITININIDKRKAAKVFKPLKGALKVTSILTFDILLGVAIAYISNILYTL